MDLVPVAFASLPLLEEGPYEGVHNVRLVLLQPVTGSGDDVQTEVIPDVEAACLGHFLLQEGVSLPPQQQHRRPDVILAQGEGAEETRRKKKHKSTVVENRNLIQLLRFQGRCFVALSRLAAVFEHNRVTVLCRRRHLHFFFLL